VGVGDIAGSALHISNTDVGLLVTVTSLVAAVASSPSAAGDRVRRRGRSAARSCSGRSDDLERGRSDLDDLLIARSSSAVSQQRRTTRRIAHRDYFPAAERGRIYGYVSRASSRGRRRFRRHGNLAALSYRSPSSSSPPAFVSRADLQAPGAARVDAMPRLAKGSSAEEPTDGDRPTDAQRLARARGLEPDPDLVLTRILVGRAVRCDGYILRIRTNVILIIASACGYSFSQACRPSASSSSPSSTGSGRRWARSCSLSSASEESAASSSRRARHLLLRRQYLNGRVLVSAVAATLAVALFVPRS